MKRLASLLLAGILLCACASGSSLKITPGPWEGVIDKISRVSFTVVLAGNAISIYSFSYPVSCSKPEFEMSLSETKIPIKNNRLEVKGGASFTVIFTAPDQAAGTWSVAEHTNSSLGKCKAASGSFMAKPKP